MTLRDDFDFRPLRRHATGGRSGPRRGACRSEGRCTETWGTKTCQEQSCVVSIFCESWDEGRSGATVVSPRGSLGCRGVWGAAGESAPKAAEGREIVREAHPFLRRPARETGSAVAVRVARAEGPGICSRSRVPGIQTSRSARKSCARPPASTRPPKRILERTSPPYPALTEESSAHRRCDGVSRPQPEAGPRGGP